MQTRQGCECMELFIRSFRCASIAHRFCQLPSRFGIDRTRASYLLAPSVFTQHVLHPFPPSPWLTRVMRNANAQNIRHQTSYLHARAGEGRRDLRRTLTSERTAGKEALMMFQHKSKHSKQQTLFQRNERHFFFCRLVSAVSDVSSKPAAQGTLKMKSIHFFIDYSPRPFSYLLGCGTLYCTCYMRNIKYRIHNGP